MMPPTFLLQPQPPLVFIHLQFEGAREEINVAVESDIKQCFSREEESTPEGFGDAEGNCKIVSVDR
jgi:hypothetical protein